MPQPLSALFYFMSTKKLTKKELNEIQKKAFALELKASYVQQCQDAIVGLTTFAPKHMEMFMFLLYGANKNKIAEFSFGVETAKIVIENLNKFIQENENL